LAEIKHLKLAERLFVVRPAGIILARDSRGTHLFVTRGSHGWFTATLPALAIGGIRGWASMSDSESRDHR